MELYKRARNGSNVTSATFYLRFTGGEDYPGPACVIVLNGVDGFKSGERSGTESEIHKLIGVPTPLSPGYILFLFSPRFFVYTAILMSIPPSL